MKDHPIVIFASDLMISTRIESAVDALNYTAITVASLDFFGFKNEKAIFNQPGEPVIGPNAQLVDWITLEQPALLIIDLSINFVPWREWLAVIKSSPSTRNIPIICFGPHVDIHRLETARKMGADLAIPRSKFLNNLGGLIFDYSRDFHEQERVSSCGQSLSALALKGLQEFNRGNYYLAHEYLEDAWNDEAGIGRELYRGILQVAVAYLQIDRENYPGAVKMVMRSRQWLGPLPDHCRTVNVAQLRIDSEKVYQELLSLGPKELSKFDRGIIRPIIFDSSNFSGAS